MGGLCLIGISTNIQLNCYCRTTAEPQEMLLLPSLKAGAIDRVEPKLGNQRPHGSATMVAP